MGFKPATLIDVRDEGTSQGFVSAIDFAGAGVSAAVSGSVATVTISGGGGGGGAPTTAQYVVLTTDGTLSDERVLTGTSNQITVTDNGAGSTVVLSTPQDINSTADVQFDSLGLGTAASGTAGALSLSTGGAYVNSTSAGGFNFYPEGTANISTITFGRGATTGDSGGAQNQTSIRIWSQTGANSLQGSNYLNPVLTFGASDGTNFNRAYEIGSEGNWTNAGGYTQQRLYVWQFDPNGANGKTLLYTDLSDPSLWIFPPPSSSTETGASVFVGGKEFRQAAGTGYGADGAYALKVEGSVTESAATGATWNIVDIKPTLNTSASNNATVNLLRLDSTNTSTTGLTTNLFSFAYGGTQRARMTSAGRMRLGTGTPLHQWSQLAAVSDFSNGTTWVDGAAQYAAAVMRADLDETIAGNVRANMTEVTYTPTTATNRTIAGLFGTAAIGGSQTLTTTNIRGLSGLGYSSSTGTTNELTGGYYLAQNNAAGTVTTKSGVRVLIGNTTASAVTTAGYGVRVDNIVNLGTYTDTFGVWVGDMTSGTQTNQAWTFYGSDANSRSYLAHSLNIGGTANRGTTEGTNQIKMFDGTAPVGTLANGVSLYSSSGLPYAMDASGFDIPLTNYIGLSLALAAGLN